MQIYHFGIIPPVGDIDYTMVEGLQGESLTEMHGVPPKHKRLAVLNLASTNTTTGLYRTFIHK